MAIPVGQRLGPYEILSAIGAGGMGEVYRARDTRLDRTVAIKVLPTHLADKPDLRERFEREAKTIASLNHPHICTLYDVGHQNGTDYLVMEYLEGETLAERLKKGPLPLNQVLHSRTDLFSFGTVLYEMATGSLPFRGDTSAVIFDAILNRAPVAPVRLNPEVPPELEQIIKKTLEKDRELRCQSAAELRADLKQLKRELDSGRSAVGAAVPSSATASVQTPPVGSAILSTAKRGSSSEGAIATAPAWWQRKSVLAIAAAIGLLVLLGVGGWFYRSRGGGGETIDSVAVLPFALNPSYPMAHLWYANVLRKVGRFDQAIAEDKRALELDPFLVVANWMLGQTFYFAQRYDEAEEQLRKTLEMDPAFPGAQLFLGETYIQESKYKEGIIELEKMTEVLPGNPAVLSVLAYGYAVSGRRTYAQKVLDKLNELSKQKYVAAESRATIYVGLGENDKAFEWLDKGYVDREFFMNFVRVDPIFDPLRSDPRFADLLRCMNLQS